MDMKKINSLIASMEKLAANPQKDKDFQRLKKKIVDFCNREYLKTQKFYTECQNSFDLATQGLECFSELA